MKTIRLENMNWPDIKDAIARGYTTAVFAIGSTEQHGPALPLKTDTLIGDTVANRVALKLGRALQAPTIHAGCSDHHLAFPGTVSLKAGTLKAVIHDYVDSLVHHGFTTLVLLPSHGGNFATVQQAIEEARQKHPGVTIIGYTNLLDFVKLFCEASAEFGVSGGAAGAHAGESEASIMMALAGDLVASDRFAPGYTGPLGKDELDVIYQKGMPALTSNGILGDPTTASAEKGTSYLDRVTDALALGVSKQMS